MGKYKNHQERLKIVSLNLQKKFAEVRIFERHVGMFLTQNGAPIMINKPGMADLYGIIKTPMGAMHFEIEIKTGSSRLSPNQKKWKTFCEKMNILHLTIFDDTDYLKTFDDYIKHLREKMGKPNLKIISN